jgi:glucose/arabinose dehydrogenase
MAETAALGGAPLTSVRVASGLSYPVFACSPSGDLERLFIVEQPGRIKILDLIGGTVGGTPFLDISSLVSFSGERGLLSMAFHPDYDANGTFFVNYTNNSGNTVIARYTVSGDPDVADPGSAVILKTINQDFSNHNGGQVQFGPDGYLYVGMGDGGSAGDPYQRAQDPGSLLGKMLRLDVDNPPDFIPSDNPFVGRPPLDEIWALGVRNPWRFSFDRLTDDLYIADVGQNAWEEIDFQPAASTGGENYGWDCMEGTHCYGGGACTCGDPSLKLPIYEYSHGVGCSITGGYVYRGCAVPDLQGTYFFADYCSDKIWSFRYDGVSITDFTERTAELVPDVGSISSISSFGEDVAGEHYICDLYGGELFKIVPATPLNPADINADGSLDLDDVVILIQVLLGEDPGEDCLVIRADVNGDGKTNGLDIAAWVAEI